MTRGSLTVIHVSFLVTLVHLMNVKGYPVLGVQEILSVYIETPYIERARLFGYQELDKLIIIDQDLRFMHTVCPRSLVHFLYSEYTMKIGKGLLDILEYVSNHDLKNPAIYIFIWVQEK